MFNLFATILSALSNLQTFKLRGKLPSLPSHLLCKSTMYSIGTLLTHLKFLSTTYAEMPETDNEITGFMKLSLRRNHATFYH